MTQAEKEKFAVLTNFLHLHSREIYERISKERLQPQSNGPKKKPALYEVDTLRVIATLADSLIESKQETSILEQLGERIARRLIPQHVTLTEALAEIQHVKQGILDALEQAGCLYTLTVQEVCAFNSLFMTNCDRIISKLALEYSNSYSQRETDDYVAALTDNIIDAVISTDNDYRIATWNKGAEALYGWSAEEVKGKYVRDVLENEFPDNPHGREEAQMAMARYGQWRGEAIQTRKDGTKIPIFSFVSVVKDAENKKIGTVAVNRDITDQKRQEANAALLAKVAEDFATLSSPDEIMQAAGGRIGEFLHVEYCHFALIDEAHDEVTYLDRWNAPHVPRQPDKLRLSEHVSGDFYQRVYAKETVVSNNTQINPITKGEENAKIGALAFITVPFYQHGEWKYLFTVHSVQPREWREDEVELVRELANRVFPRLERARAEEKLIKSEEHFRAMADNIPNLAWMAKPDGYIYWYNKRWYDYTGTTSKDMEGWGWQSVHDPQQLPLVLERWQASIAAGEQFDMVFPLRGNDNVFRPFLTRVMPVKDHKGEVIHWFGTNTDISEQIQIEEALRVSKEKQEETLALLESLLKNAPVGFAFFDKEHRYIRINDTLAQINGLPAQDHIGKKIEELLPVNAKTVAPVLDKVVETKEPVLDFEVTGQTPKRPGETRYWLTGFYPVFIGKSATVDFVGGVVTEITNIKRLEQQKDEFLAVASHELKTPVTSIKAYAQVLQRLFKNKGDISSFELLGKMDAQINKLITLIADLLDVSKMQAGKLQLRLDHFDFNALVSEIVDEIQRTTARHTIHTELMGNKMVYGDKDRLGQVITNFLTNAVKYSPHADTIIVKTEATAHTITLSVQDFGLGIPKTKQGRVFERFYRVDGSKDNLYPGLGLGLYISSEIIRRHGGTIWVESEEGQGSTFGFTVPIEERLLPQPEDTLDEEAIKQE